MRNLSEEFVEQQNKGNHDYQKFVDITLKDGTVLHLTNKHLWSNGFSFYDSVSSQDNFDIGSAIVNKFKIVINNIYDEFSNYVFAGSTAVVYVGLRLSNCVEKIRICTGVLSDEPKQRSSIITLQFLDNMSKFDKDYSEVKTLFPATRNQIVRDICSYCGVTLQTVNFDNDSYIIKSRPDDEALTCRQMLAWVAQIGCQWAKCDEYGRLCFEWYNTKLTNEQMVRIKSTSGEPVVNIEDVVITGVRVTEYIENASEDKPAKRYLYGTEGYVLNITGNKLIKEGTGQTISSMIGEKCVGMRFRPFEASCLTDISIEAGDTITVTDRKGNTFLSYATNVKLQPGNYESISCGAESSERNSAKQYSLLTQAEVAARKNIQKEKTEREKALEELAVRLENSPGVFTTVETDTGGGKIYYLHNKPKLSDSDMVWKMTAEAWSVSTDGGKTWNAGMTVDGDTIVRILTATGVNADWINAGAITVKDSNKNIIFSVNMDTKRVIISGESVQIGGRPVQDVINSGITESKNYSDEKLSDYANTVTKDLENLQAQVDGQVEDYYYDYEPSMQNIPASKWTTTEERQKHIGDRFFWKSKGYAYRFMEDNGIWGWTLLQDTDITKAMQTAQNAKDVADGKRRTFITQPVPPYDIGDMWANGEDILTCSVSRASGTSYVSSDWEKLNNYTDDTVANQALEEARKANNLTVILDNNFQGIPADYNGNITVFPTVKTRVAVFRGYSDISENCIYSVAKSDSVTGSWDNTKREYTVTGLSADTGWVDITASYMSLFTSTKRFSVAKSNGGTPGPDGKPGRTYFLEPSTLVVKRSKDNETIPNFVNFKSFYRDGDKEERVAYTGRFKIEETKDGKTWNTVYVSDKDESEIRHHIYTFLTSESGNLLFTESGYAVGFARDIEAIRCTLYASGGMQTELDIQMISIVRDVDNLTHEEIFNLFTNNGEIKGIFKEGNQLYINADFIATGIITDLKGNNYWNLDTGEFRLSSTTTVGGKTVTDIAKNTATEIAKKESSDAVKSQTQDDIFNKLTNDGIVKAIILKDGQLYINADYIYTGTLKVGGENNEYGILNIINNSGKIVGIWDRNGLFVNNENLENNVHIYDGKIVFGSIDGSQSRIMHFGGNIRGLSVTADKSIRFTINDSANESRANELVNVSPYEMYSTDAQITHDFSGKALFRQGIESENIISKIISGVNKITASYLYIGRIYFPNAGDLYLGYAAGSENRIHVNGGIQCSGGFVAQGTKSRDVKTKDYSNRLLYCYEMPSPYFGDSGEAETDESGVCYIYLDDIFQETINTNIEYQVFLQKEGQGDLWVNLKESTYFVVKGTPGLKFSWEIKAKQRDYEYERLESTEMTRNYVEIIDYEAQGQKLFEEYLLEKETAYEESN